MMMVIKNVSARNRIIKIVFKALIDYFNKWKVIPAGISVQFNEEGNGKMWLEYVSILL